MKEIELYIAGLKLGDNKSQATITKYESVLAKFEAYFKPQTMEDIKKIKVQDYYSFYESQEGLKKANSKNDLIRSLSAFFTWLEVNDFISVSENAFRKVRFGGKKFFKVPSEEVEILTDEELEKMINAARTTQERLMICLLTFHGFRAGTLASIKLSDIQNCSLTAYGKGRVRRIVSLHPTVCALLNSHLADRDTDSDYLFYGERGEVSMSGKLSGASINNRTKAAARRAGLSEERVKNIHTHLFRHTLGTNLYSTYGVDVAQEALWHMSPATTQLYNHSGNAHSNSILVNQRNLNVTES